MDNNELKILSLGVDKSALDRNSKLASRLLGYSELFKNFFLIVPASENAVVELSEKIKIFGVGPRNKFFTLFNIYFFANRLIGQEKLNLIIVQDPYYLALLAWLLAKKNKIGWEIQIHGFEKKHGLRKFLANFLIPRASAWRVVSQRLANELVGEYKISRDKITVVPIYAELQVKNSPEFQEASKLKTKEDKESFIFLTVGRFVPVKNIVLQIEALVEVVKKYSNVELWIVGEGLEIKNYESKIKNYGLCDNVKIFSWQKDLGSFYRRADCFVLSSDYEGWGLVVVEAASFGLPIIMTDVGCAGEVIKNNESGVVIPVGGKDSLVSVMDKMMNDEKFRKRVGDEAKEAVSKLPTKEETLNLYQASWLKALK
jgi:glycosyltransferase involved in cell wall biosynthesis